METVIQQLRNVRRIGRLLLLAQRAMQWLCGFVALAVACGFLDFALRLPGWLRLVVGLLAVGWGLTWLGKRIIRVWNFSPGLTTLALRAERMFPELAGNLASAVEFAASPQVYAKPRQTADFVRASLALARTAAVDVPLQKMLDPVPARRWLGVLFIVSVSFGGLVSAAPDSSLLAFRRWVLPLGSTQWPTRQSIESLVAAEVAPVDQPLSMEARLRRGYGRDVRAFLHYRVIHPEDRPGMWQSNLMSRHTVEDGQGEARFARLLDLRDEVGDLFPPRIESKLPWAGLEFYFSAGDGRTQPQRVRLVPRPEVCRVKVSIEPPIYAQGVVTDRDVLLDSADQEDSRVMTASALQGALVRLRIELNKPIRWSDQTLLAVLPGAEGIDLVTSASLELGMDSDACQWHDSANIQLAFRLDRTIRSPIQLVDEFGLRNMSDRTYQILAVPDELPTVAVIDPPSDELVLPSAVVKLTAVAQDDVGLASLQFDSEVVRDASDGRETKESRTLAFDSDLSQRMQLEHQFVLRELEVVPGDEVVISALAQDIYEADDGRHRPVRSAPLRLRVIDQATLAKQMRGELTNVREKAIRIERHQGKVQDQAVELARSGQEQITRRVRNQKLVLDALRRRMEKNQLDAPTLEELIEQGRELLASAENHSQSSAKHLAMSRNKESKRDGRRAGESARSDQGQVRRDLADLIGLLDQTKDALALQLKLKSMETAQQQLASAVRRMLPLTAGESPDQLPDPERRKLEDLGTTQKQMVKQVESLVDQMQSTAENLSRGEISPRDEAAAMALAEAAAIAQRQGLSQSMGRSGQQIRKNQLSQAGTSQQGTLDVLRQMLEQFQDQMQLRQQILRRVLVRLEESIGKLIEQQQAHLNRLARSVDVAALAPALGSLRNNTLAVEQQARTAPMAERIAHMLGESASHQTGAMETLRIGNRVQAEASQRAALDRLIESLETLQKLQDQLQMDENRKEREELKAAYEKLATDQLRIRDGTEPFTRMDNLSRKQRMELHRLGNDEADVRVAAAELGDQLQQSVLFSHAHARIDQLSAAVVGRLRMGTVGAPILRYQAQIATYLDRMALALRQELAEEEFASGQSGDTGGGGNGGGDATSRLATSMAELKLLRELQRGVYQRTAGLNRKLGTGDASPQNAVEQLRGLSIEQLELKVLGERLVDRLSDDMQSLQQRGGERQPEGSH